MLNKIKAIAAARREGTDNEAGLDLIQIVLAVGISLLLVSVAISGIGAIQSNARQVAVSNAAESIYTSLVAEQQSTPALDTAAADAKAETLVPDGMTVEATVTGGDITVTVTNDSDTTKTSTVGAVTP